MRILIEVVGWTAAAMMLTACVLLNMWQITTKSKIFQWLNALSGAQFVVNSGWNGAFPSAVINADRLTLIYNSIIFEL